MKQRFGIVQKRNWFFALSLTITVVGLIVFLVQGFNLGTDFKAGSRVQLQLNQPVNVKSIDAMFTKAGIPVNQDAITVAGIRGDTAVVRFPELLTPAQVQKINIVEKQFFPKALAPQAQSVSPIVAKQTSQKAVWAVLLASLFILIYVAIRFEYRFAVAAVAALLHDAFIVLAVFSILHLEIDLTFIAAILTIVGYSINDTIVIFDRIRENQKIAKPRTYEELQRMVDKSLWQTMSRSINTVITVLIAALMLYFFGGQSIHNFTFALIVGLVSGAYSSIFIASPIWVVWRGRTMKKEPKQKEAPSAS